jgi:ribonuclease PH
VQGTAEGAPFDRAELNTLLDLALGGTTTLTALQAAALEPYVGGATALSL